MNRVEIKKWAKEKVKGHLWEILIPIMVTSILTSLTIGTHYTLKDGKLIESLGCPVGIFFAFVEVGLTYFMLNFIHDKKYNFKDLFAFTGDYVRIFLTKLLSTIYLVLWTLLFIIPGIIKSYAYSLIPLLLEDKKNNDLSASEIIKKSQELMKGHKMDLFLFDLSFLGWHLLAIFTLFILEIWIVPYYNTAKIKMLDDIKKGAK